MRCAARERGDGGAAEPDRVPTRIWSIEWCPKGDRFRAQLGPSSHNTRARTRGGSVVTSQRGKSWHARAQRPGMSKKLGI